MFCRRTCRRLGKDRRGSKLGGCSGRRGLQSGNASSVTGRTWATARISGASGADPTPPGASGDGPMCFRGNPEGAAAVATLVSTVQSWGQGCGAPSGPYSPVPGVVHRVRRDPP